MFTFFYILASMSLLEGIYSLISGYKYLRYVRGELKKPLKGYLPRTALIVPFKDVDPGFKDNITSIITQDYPNYYIILVTTSENDQSYSILQQIVKENPDTEIKLITSEVSKTCGQKVMNLIKAVEVVEDDTEVMAFADSDVRPGSDWLKNLVDPLNDDEIGATTGYRWYLPVKGEFWSVLRSVWNGGVATLLGGHKRNFAWGGSMAIRKKVFDEAKVLGYWKGALSDDYALTRAVKDAGYYVKFVPKCLVASFEDTDLKDLLEWTTRQIIITKIYSPNLWKLASISQILYNLTLLLGLGLILAGLLQSNNVTLVLMLILIILSFGFIKGAMRFIAISRVLKPYREKLNKYWWAYCLLSPLTSMLTLYNILMSMTTNRIKWRGIEYEMKSPERTIVLS